MAELGKKKRVAVMSRCCRHVLVQSELGDSGLPPSPPPHLLWAYACFFFLPLLFLHVSPRHAHAADTEPCGSVTLSRQLRSALLWSGATARYYNQGQGGGGGGGADCWMLRETHLNANVHERPNKWINK